MPSPTLTRRRFAALGLAAPAVWGLADVARALPRVPLVIASGVAVGDAPARSRAAYEAAIRDGADILAVDFAPCKDGTLVAAGDRELSTFTDVATRAPFSDRRQTQFVDGKERAGWFAEAFTLPELKSLTLAGAPPPKRRGPQAEPAAILTFDEVVAIARAGSIRTARVIGIQAGMVRPAYFASLDLAVEPRLAAAIHAAGYDYAAAAMTVASADEAALRTVGGLTRARRILRLDADGQGPSGADLGRLTAIRAVAEAIAVPPTALVDLATPKTLPATELVARAHAAGLAVQAWAPAAPAFPPPPLRPGDARRVLAAVYAAGADALAAEPVALAVRARADAIPAARDQG